MPVLRRLELQAAAFFCQAFFVALGAERVFPGQVAVGGANGERGRDGDVGQAKAGERTLDELAAGCAAADALTHIQVQHGAAGVFGLQRFLALQGFKRVVGKADGQLRAVGVVGLLRRARLEDGGPALFVLFGKAVGGAFCRGGLQVKEVASLF